MPLTPLFPAVHESLVIKQGNAGDCYLLSSLDCLYNQGKEGPAFLKSLFTQDADGITLRIKRSQHSIKLNARKMEGKYHYSYDKEAEEDVFYIPNKRLEEMDSRKEGVQTNSLAIKILESIITYYYDVSAKPGDPVALESVFLHNEEIRYHGKSTQFIADVLGIMVTNYDDDFDHIIRLKEKNPDEPVYISMQYGINDASGMKHPRHALRIDKIKPLSNGDYEFSLINPWDNTTRESYKLSYLRTRQCTLCVFNTNKNQSALQKLSQYKALSPEIKKYIDNHQEFLDLLGAMQNKGLLTKAQMILAPTQLHKKHPYLTTLYKLLNETEQEHFLHQLATATDNKKFLISIIKNAPRLDVLKCLLEKEQDKKTIDEIMEHIAHEVNSGKQPKIKAIFNSHDFFDTVIQIVSKKPQQLMEIDLSLMKYFNHNDPGSITRAAGLRALIINNIFTKRTICLNFLAYGLKDHGVHYANSNEMQTFIGSQLDIEEPDALFEDLFKICKFNNARKMFVDLHQLSLKYPQWVEKIMPLAYKKMDDFFYESLEILSKAINDEPDSKFKTWFLRFSKKPQPQPLAIAPAVDANKASGPDAKIIGATDDLTIKIAGSIIPEPREKKAITGELKTPDDDIAAKSITPNKEPMNPILKTPLGKSFQKNIAAIKTLVSSLGKIAEKDTAYTHAVVEMGILSTNLSSHWISFLAQPTKPDNMQTLQQNCNQSFRAALDVIEKHRGWGWGQVIVAIVQAINSLAVALNLVDKESTNWKFFTPKTNTEIKVKDIQDDLNREMKPGNS